MDDTISQLQELYRRRSELAFLMYHVQRLTPAEWAAERERLALGDKTLEEAYDETQKMINEIKENRAWIISHLR